MAEQHVETYQLPPSGLMETSGANRRCLREILESEEWSQTSSKIPIILGKDDSGKVLTVDLAKMPHCLIAGTTGSGKSACIDAIIASLLFRFSPDDLRFVMIDLKGVDLQVYNPLPHLVMPVVTNPKNIVLSLRWVVNEIENRYKILASTGVRNQTGFNERLRPKSESALDPAKETKEPGSLPIVSKTSRIHVQRDVDLVIPDRLPLIIVIVDGLANLTSVHPKRKDEDELAARLENNIAQIVQMGQAAGVHMIATTQTFYANVLTNRIMSNIPTRIAFRLTSPKESIATLHKSGAERLVGQGTFFYHSPEASDLIQSCGILVSDEELRRLVNFVSAQGAPAFDPAIQNRLESSHQDVGNMSEEDEALVEKSLEIIRQEGRASTSMLQRRLRLGYASAARVIDILEKRGILGPGDGAKPREILVSFD